MKIAYITAGAGAMYCGSCIRDNTLAAALQKKGHETALIPIYTPLRTDETSVSLKRVFYGAINVYLEQKFSLFGHTPQLLHRLLDQPGLLKWASGFAASTDARDLGALTLSVLQGEEGRQRRELLELVGWLRDSFQPEVVQLTNSMLLGLARELKRQLAVPVVCAMQGEDLFLDSLAEPYKSKVLETLRKRADDADLFIATNRYYAEYMADFLGVAPEKIHVARLGINLDGHGEGDRSTSAEPHVIGYLARICPEKGLHLLAEGFRILSERLGPGRVELRAAGYLGQRDRSYLQGVTKKLEANGLGEHFEYLGEVDRGHKIDFLKGLDLLSVPTTCREPKGLYVLEALANGVPVVQPDHGAFPELIEATGGGILVTPDSPKDLADGIEGLLADGEQREELGRQGKEAVHRYFSAEAMADETLEGYRYALSLAAEG